MKIKSFKRMTVTLAMSDRSTAPVLRMFFVLGVESLGSLYNREQVASFMPVLNSNIEADVDFLTPYFVGQLARPGFEFLRLARQPFGLAAIGD